MGIMKKIFLFIILLSVYSFGQENRLVRSNDLTDSLNVIRSSIAGVEAGNFDTTFVYQEIATKLNISDTTGNYTKYYQVPMKWPATNGIAIHTNGSWSTTSDAHLDWNQAFSWVNSYGYTDYLRSGAIKTLIGDSVANKQNVLVSGTNIKTINSNSLLGSGNLTIQTTDSTAVNGLIQDYNDSTTVSSTHTTAEIDSTVDRLTRLLNDTNIPSDSTGLPTGALYFRADDGIIRRKY
jgi:hypothetical protein